MFCERIFSGKHNWIAKCCGARTKKGNEVDLELQRIASMLTMGSMGLSSPSLNSQPKQSFLANLDRFATIEDLQEALRKSGLESSNLIIGIDYTGSNQVTGKKSFYGESLHSVKVVRNGLVLQNPYQEVISIVGRTLEPFDDDKLIPVFGFGDVHTSDHSVFPFFPDRPCNGFQEVLDRYSAITPKIELSGPTSFAPLVYQAIDIVKKSGSYHILIIICDGQVDEVKTTAAAIIEASKYPLSIICIGVGDGPWELMKEFDDKLPERKFDNFQFVDFCDIKRKVQASCDVAFSINALMEIPDQYSYIKKNFLS